MLGKRNMEMLGKRTMEMLGKRNMEMLGKRNVELLGFALPSHSLSIASTGLGGTWITGSGRWRCWGSGRKRRMPGLPTVPSTYPVRPPDLARSRTEVGP